KLVAGHDLLAAEPQAEVLAPELIEGDVPLVELDPVADPGDGAETLRAQRSDTGDAGVLELDPGGHILGEPALGRDPDAIRPEQAAVVGVVVEVLGVVV